MRQKNKTTVAIPVRNGSDYLEETITLLFDAPVSEILISNNFSNDATENILSRFPNLTIIKPSLPITMAENWNFVTKNIKTEYFRLVSHDDLPNLQSFIEHETILDTNPEVGMVFSRRGLIIDGRNKRINLGAGRFHSKIYKNSLDLFENICKSGTNPCGETFTVTIRTKLFQSSENKISWFDNEPFELDTWLQISRQMQIVEAKTIGGRFRVHLNSHSGLIPNYFLQGNKVISWARKQPEYHSIRIQEKVLLVLTIKSRALLRYFAFKFIKFL